LERTGAETNINFWFGSAIHYAFEDYFGWNRFGDPRLAFEAYYKAFDEDDRPEAADIMQPIGLSMLTYFLTWYPRHNELYGLETLWLDEQNRPVKPHTPGARPCVEESFTLDLGVKVIVDAATNEIIKELEPGDRLVLYTPLIAGDGQLDDLYFWEDQVVYIVPVYYHGTLDRVCIDKHGRIYILDYKTAKSADTAKLETDDQISAYMWAAEQHLKLPIYEFIYLQLTKDAIKPPKRLKDGSLSVDKKQKTTYDLVRRALLEEFGKISAAPSKYIDFLNHMVETETPEGDRFIRWDFVKRSKAQKIATYNHIMAELSLMLWPNLKVYPSPTRDCGWDCPFREICILMDDDMRSEADRILMSNYAQRTQDNEHSIEDWKDNLEFPDVPAVLDLESLGLQDLFPEDIMEIILPEQYR